MTNKKSKLFTTLFFFTLIVFFLSPSVQAQTPGTFVGQVVTSWENNGRDMRLVEDFGYIALDGTEWPVPKGTVVDGASIPRFLWSVVGSPYRGKYRFASVVHDHYCVTKNRPSAVVHKIFHEASLAAGMTEKMAWVMYQAVDTFGPSWKRKQIPGCEVITEENLDDCVENSTLEFTETQDPSDAEINAFLDKMKNQGYVSEAEEIRQSLN